MYILPLQKKLREERNKSVADNLSRFFKTRTGDYGEGDQFLGLKVPQTRSVIRQFMTMPPETLAIVLRSKFHEERLAALLILVHQFQMAKSQLVRKKIFSFYLHHTRYINNWDLVDLTAPHIVGAYIADKEKSVLIKLSRSKNIWERRIAVLSTFYFIRNGSCGESLRVARLLLHDPHDLIHKAVGWMLREVGKRCSQQVLEKYLLKYYQIMPRTMLRYAIERFP